MVRTVHMNNFYETSLQISDPKIRFSTKTHLFENGHVQNFGKCCFWREKSPCGVPPQQNTGFKHNIPINVPRTVHKVTIIRFIWPKIVRKPENKFYNRINLLICVSGYYSEEYNMMAVVKSQGSKCQ